MNIGELHIQLAMLMANDLPTESRVFITTLEGEFDIGCLEIQNGELSIQSDEAGE